MKQLLYLAACCSLLATTAIAQNVGIGTTNPQAQLHTTGSVRLEALSGTGTHLVYATENGMLTTEPVTQYNGIPVAIFDNSCAAATSIINVTGMPNAVNTGSIKVKVNITHAYVGDLVLLLISPEGDVIDLAHRIGGNGDNFVNTIFWDSAASLINGSAPPYTGTYKPQGSLATTCSNVAGAAKFSDLSNGSINPNGTWTLKVFDQNTNDAGTINNWSISFESTEPLSPALAYNYVVKANDKGKTVGGSIYDNGNIGIGTAAPENKLEVVGTAKVTSLNTGKITTPTTSTNNMLPVAYGYVSASGNITNGSGNWTLTHAAGTASYDILFTDSDLANTFFSSLPINATMSGSSPGFITYNGFQGKVTFNTFNSTGSANDRGFSFVVYKR